MNQIRTINIKANVKELAREIPIEVFTYEFGLDDIMGQLVKVFGKSDVQESLDETIKWISEGNKL